MPKNIENQKFQEKYLEYNFLKSQMQGLSEELSTLSATSQAFNIAKEAIENLGKEEKNAEILVPLGAQIFANASIQNAKEVLVNVGAGVLIKKEIPKALESIEKQEKEISSIAEEVTVHMKEMGKKIDEIEPVLEEFAKKAKAGQK